MHSAGYKSCTIHYDGDMDGEVIITDYDHKKRKLHAARKDYPEIKEVRVKVSDLIKGFEFCCANNITTKQFYSKREPFIVDVKDIGYFLSERLQHHIITHLEDCTSCNYFKVKDAAKYLGISKKVIEGNN